MPIKLLSKQEVSQRQAEQQRAIINEGVKLAKRVDALREISANEELSLAKFRDTTLREIKKQTDIAQNERDMLIGEVSELRKELSEGTARLDERENHLNDIATKLSEQQKQLHIGNTALISLTQSIKTQEKEVKTVAQKLKNVWDVLVEYGKTIGERYAESIELLKQAQQKADTIQRLASSLEEELKVRDIAVASRERDVTIKEERILRTFKEQRERELQLRDREFTLEREFKRLKK